MKRWSLDRKAAAMFPASDGGWVKYSDVVAAMGAPASAAPFIDPDVAAAIDDKQVQLLRAELYSGVDIDRVHARFAAKPAAAKRAEAVAA